MAEAPPEADEASVPQLPIHEMHWQALPHQSAYADSFSLRAKSRLRRLRFDTRLRAQPRGGSLRDAKRGRFRALFFYLQIPVPLSPPHNKPSGAYQRHGLGGNYRKPDAVHADDERQGQDGHDLEQQRAQEGDAADTAPLFSAVKNAEPKMLKPDRIKLMQYSFMPWVVSASSPAS